jgi:hypothetical protein
MDIVFHALSAGTLAYYLGEKRPSRLVGAAIIGCVPDFTWPLVQMDPAARWLYSLTHSLVFNALIVGIICGFNWRIAFGGILHILIDTGTHSSSTMHLLFPWTEIKLWPGTNWWQWPGIMLWAGLWALLIIFLLGRTSVTAKISLFTSRFPYRPGRKT